MQRAKTLIRLVGCPGRSGFWLSTQPHCWFCYVAAQTSSVFVFQRKRKRKLEDDTISLQSFDSGNKVGFLEYNKSRETTTTHS